MSARSVCSGSWPCRYHSERAISAPFRRPDTRTLMPLAPKRRAASTALRMARRKAMRFSSCSATDSDTSWASSSGFRISWMLMKTSLPVFFWISCLQLVDLLPLAADDDAGARGEDADLQLVGGALDLDPRDARVGEALLQVLLRAPGPRAGGSAYSFSAYQRLRQVLLKPRRNPMGWTF